MKICHFFPTICIDQIKSPMVWIDGHQNIPKYREDLRKRAVANQPGSAMVNPSNDFHFYNEHKARPYCDDCGIRIGEWNKILACEKFMGDKLGRERVYENTTWCEQVRYRDGGFIFNWLINIEALWFFVRIATKALNN